MSGRRKRRDPGGFLCFGALVDDAEDELETELNSCEELHAVSESGRRKRWPLIRRVLAKLFKSLTSMSCSNLSKKQRHDSKRSSAGKGLGLVDEKSLLESSRKSTDDGGRKSGDLLSIYSVFSSSSSSSSSPLSSRFSSEAHSSALKDPRERKKAASASAATESAKPPLLSPSRALASAERKNGPVTGLFLLLVSLTLIVFCGRICSILWTSSWLCVVARRNFDCRRQPLVAEKDGGEEELEVAVTAAAAAPETAELRKKALAKEEEMKKQVIMKGMLERSRNLS